MMRHSVGREGQRPLLAGFRHRLARPLDVAGRDPRRYQPVVARPIDGLLRIDELDLDAVFQFEPAFVAGCRGENQRGMMSVLVERETAARRVTFLLVPA